MICQVNVFAHKVGSGTVLNVLDALPDNFMLTVDVIVQMEHSLTELNVLLKLLINVLELLTPIGMELIVFASQDFQPLEIHAIVMELF
jgi:hypothetical protein